MAKMNPVDSEIEAALKSIEKQIEQIRKLQARRAAGFKAAATRARRKQAAARKAKA
jgi:ribosomal protein S21